MYNTAIGVCNTRSPYITHHNIRYNTLHPTE